MPPKRSASPSNEDHRPLKQPTINSFFSRVAASASLTFGSLSIQVNASATASAAVEKSAPARPSERFGLDSLTASPGLPEGYVLPADINKTKRLLYACPVSRAVESLVGLTNGLRARGPAPAIPAATQTKLGCIVSSARRTIQGGHTGLVPLQPRKTTRAPNGAGPQTERQPQQAAHRLAIRAYGTPAQQRGLFEEQMDVSHLCHQPACY